MSEELKPCPFCGSAPERAADGCVACFADSCPIRYLIATREVWNTRAQPAEQQDGPVAWRVPISGMYEFFRTKEAALKERADYESDFTPEEIEEVRSDRDPEPLYRRPAAQAVKLPARQEPDWSVPGGVAKAEGFNDALDAVAKLNGIEP